MPKTVPHNTTMPITVTHHNMFKYRHSYIGLAKTMPTTVPHNTTMPITVTHHNMFNVEAQLLITICSGFKHSYSSQYVQGLSTVAHHNMFNVEAQLLITICLRFKHSYSSQYV